ncbi:Na/Pi cotransporter family protein [Clostridium sp. CF011]|uniref:Na/Pi cotransporter family protein n=1 Tax=unclassified Clostridium TaxID=2614128 RepID=UPI001C0B63DA|nr:MULTISPECIES: Na/Pi cotransporter family protein [unclassified Clostridium]MBU3090958.1 Na/Pi cotransporter family protein [Clostridium sp. CF011]MBW9144476.1 Na/Pi cotransporter family protein [Clostridium sp. CM027]UVE40751.1 Na/Pi cotransporter family protein [Clostridium sp. CM027]WAG69722.1 Na/Pi cotransporter family protein [Clostridium sp. CF011]
MDYKMIFQLLGGLGLFVYGMKLMGDGLQKAAGEKLKKMLEVLTSNRFFAVLVGAGVTAIIQSSSATTVMTIGFVNAGLMNLFQAAGVIMGANVGTTMTAQLIAFKLTDVAPFVLAIGAALVLFCKNKKTKDIGEIVLGFGILFVGMSMMETAMSPLSELDSFKNLILVLGKHPFMGVIVGLCMTATIQSSSATIGILMALASNSSITLAVALPILFGDNIGTCATALLASIGTTKNAKRAALLHLIFNFTGTLIFMVAFKLVLKIVPMFGGDVQRQIANAHTLFNVSNVFIQVWFINALVKIVNKLVPGEDEKSSALVLEYLDRRLLETPSIAVGQLIKEVTRMGQLASVNLSNAMQSFLNCDEKMMNSVIDHEVTINYLEREITSYMVSLSNTSLSEHQSEIITSLYNVVNDIERIGDHADNLGELAKSRMVNKLIFSEKSLSDVTYMFETVKYCVDNAIAALENSDLESARKAMNVEKKIDTMERQLKKEHISRLSRLECTPAGSSVYLELLTNLERVGDHSNNIAQMVVSSN